MPSEGYDHQSGHCLNATVSLMLWGRFIYECAEICLWRGSLSIDMVHSDINLKALAVCAAFLLVLDTEVLCGSVIVSN